jgi:hypothetical protein
MKRTLTLIGINLIPFTLIALNVSELINVYSGKGDYPFESEFFAPLSIYQSQNAYVSYTILFSLFLIALIVSSFLRKKKVYWGLLILCLLFFAYPFFTNE